MKIFQKIMCLLLVISMACGFAFGANYTDANTITQTEAVDVMSALGVMAGYPDGSMKPTGDVTRAEMAKMIATILNQGEDVGAMYAGACTFADTASHWAAGYVAYCAQEGIINGKNATTFDPDAPVTGTEAAKMVLGMLGHDGDKAGMVGSNWASATVSLAKKYSLIGKLNNLDVNMNAPLSRENTARLLLNGLQANMVEYTGGTNITIGDIILTQGAEAKDLNTTLMVECFGTDLQALKVRGAVDTFGRVCNEWTYKNETIGFYSTVPYVVYTTETTLGQLYTDLGKVSGDKLASVSVYQNGNEIVNTIKTNLVSGNYTDTIGDQGITTEIYFDDVNMTLHIVEICVYAGEVVEVIPERKDANGDVLTEAYIRITPVDNANSATVGGALRDGTNIPTANTIVATGFVRGDIVYYTLGKATQGTQIQTVAKATPVIGVNHGWTKLGNAVTSVTINNTTYPVNAAYDYTEKTFDTAETVYLDNNGNIVYSTGVASKDYCYVMQVGQTNTFSNTYSARIITSAGEDKVIELAYIHNDDNVKAGNIYNYTVDATGKYTLTNGTATNSTGVKVMNKTAIIDENITVNNNTTFIVGVKSVNGNTIYNVYQGVFAVPSFEGDIAYATDAYGTAVVFCNDAKITGIMTDNVMVLYKTGEEAFITAGAYEQYYTVKTTTGDVRVDKTTYDGLNDGFNFISYGTMGDYNIYTALNAIDFDNDAIYSAIQFTTFDGYKDGIVMIGNVAKYVENTAPAYVWNKNTKTLTTTQVDALYNVSNGTYIYRTVNGVDQFVGIYTTVEY